MVVPMERAPGYGGMYARQQAAMAQAASERVGAELEARADVMRGVMSNAERIANVGGSEALGHLATGPGGMSTNPFGGETALRMDRLREATMNADINRMNRSGRGGGGGAASAAGPKVGNYVGMDGNVYKWSDYDRMMGAYSRVDGTFGDNFDPRPSGNTASPGVVDPATGIGDPAASVNRPATDIQQLVADIDGNLEWDETGTKVRVRGSNDPWESPY